MKKYKKIAVGGTFDRIHKGHKHLLNHAFDISDKVVIGITSDEFPKDKLLSKVILPFHERQAEVLYFLETEDLENRAEIISIDDIFGTTLTDISLEALLVTSETNKAAGIVNAKRHELGLERLAIEMIDLVVDSTHVPISSTRIRQGLINQEGEVFAQLFTHDLKISESDKQILKDPLGQLVGEDELKDVIFTIKPTKIAIVGDATLETCLNHQIDFDFAIVDGFTRRKKVKVSKYDIQEKIEAKNPAGKITHEAIDGLRRLFGLNKGLLKVDGEEDLLTLACVVLLPLKSIVLYGQPDEGVVIVRVDESTKDRWYRFLKEADKIR